MKMEYRIEWRKPSRRQASLVGLTGETEYRMEKAGIRKPLLFTIFDLRFTIVIEYSIFRIFVPFVVHSLVEKTKPILLVQCSSFSVLR
jgi:hypothetical protein